MPGSVSLRSYPFHVWALLALAVWALPAGAAGRPWILVDTGTLTLTVYASDHRALARFHNIAIGSSGGAYEHRRGDGTTPLGVYHIAWIDRHSRFGTFYGFDYPTPAVAGRAYLRGTINAAQYDAIVAAFRAHRIPPQDTPLGGQLGIHGVGAGDLRIQQDINWTNGCIALGNRQLRRLARWLQLGTKVVIR